MSYVEYKGIRYYPFDDYFIAGDNVTSAKPSAVSSTSFSGEVVIPEKVNGIQIREIGYCAFYQCSLITKITIHAKIRSINRWAFFCCTNLKYINIPETVTFIGNTALFLGNLDQTTADLPMTVEFNPGRKEPFYINFYAFSRRKTFFIIYPSFHVPLYNSQYAFYGVDEAIICAPFVFDFCTKQTTTERSKCPASLFKKQMDSTLNCNEKRIRIIIFSFLILFLVQPINKIDSRLF